MGAHHERMTTIFPSKSWTANLLRGGDEVARQMQRRLLGITARFISLFARCDSQEEPEWGRVTWKATLLKETESFEKDSRSKLVWRQKEKKRLVQKKIWPCNTNFVWFLWSSVKIQHRSISYECNCPAKSHHNPQQLTFSCFKIIF